MSGDQCKEEGDVATENEMDGLIARAPEKTTRNVERPHSWMTIVREVKTYIWLQRKSNNKKRM